METGQLTLGQLIRLARKEAGLSQRELADWIGMSYRSVQEWETDRADPTKHLRTIERVTGKPDGWISDHVDPYRKVSELDDRLRKVQKDVAEVLGLLREWKESQTP